MTDPDDDRRPSTEQPDGDTWALAPTPRTHLDDGTSVSHDGGATNELLKFFSRTPFMDLHDRAVDPELHHARHNLCFALDLIIRLIAAVLLLAIIVLVAYKTLAPIPHFW